MISVLSGKSIMSVGEVLNVVVDLVVKVSPEFCNLGKTSVQTMFGSLDNSVMVVGKNRNLVTDGSIVLASDRRQNVVKMGAVNSDSVKAFSIVIASMVDTIVHSVTVESVDVIMEPPLVGIVKINNGVQERISSSVHFMAHSGTLSRQKVSDFVDDVRNSSFTPTVSTAVGTRVAFQNGGIVAVAAPSMREVNMEAVVRRDGIDVPGVRAVVGVCVRSWSVVIVKGKSICGGNARQEH